jgi:hypothetical protein
MHTFIRGPYRFVAGALLLVVMAAGCGAGGALSLDPVASAADRTLDKGTGHFDISMTFTVPPLGRTAVTADGAFNNREQSMEMTLNLEGVGASAPNSLGFRFVYPAMYMRFDGLPTGTRLPNGKSWVKVDLERALKSLGVNLANLGVGRSPAEALAQLRGSKDTKKLGTETIDGVQTTHYRAKVSFEDALAKATPKEREGLQRLMNEAKAQGIDATPSRVDVWVGTDGLVRRMTEKLGSVGNVTMTFSDYGVPVQIEAPAAEDTIDLSKLLVSG